MSVQPGSSGNGTASPVAGASDLQAALDQNTRALEQLSTQVNNINNGNGTSTTISNSTMAEGAQFTTGSQNQMATNLGGGSGSNNGSGFLSSIANAFGGGGGGGTGGTGTGGSTGGFLANFSITRTGSLLGSAANIATSLINASGAIGQGMGQDVLQQSTYGYITQNAGYSNGSGGIVSAGQAQTAAFGSAASGQLNRLATGTTDAATGGAILTQMSDSPNFASNIPGMASPTLGYGTAPWTMAASVGMANPGLGETGSANVANALISPTASYNLQMMGVATQPIGIGGKVNSLQSVYGAIANRLMGQQLSKNGTMNQQQLTTNLNDPLMAYQMMQATGMTADEYQQWANSWEQQNQAASSKNISLGTVQNDIGQFMAGKMSAATLQKQTGISGSAWENSVQSQAATNMGATNDNSAAFVQGLQSATTAINSLTVMMGTFLSLMGGAGAKISGESAGAGISIDSGNLASTSLGSTVTEGAALAGVSTSQFSSALSSALGSAVSSFETGSTPSTTGVADTANTSVPTSTAAGGSASANQKIAQSLLTKYGWNNTTQWNDLVKLWTQESSWNNKAMNPSSGAYGIAQALGHAQGASVADNKKGDNYPDAYKSANPAPWGNSDAGMQISWGLDYIKTTYGSPSAAWNHEVSAGWYASGTDSANQGVAMVGERGPELVRLSGGQQIMNAAQTFNAVQAPYTSANRLLAGSFSGQRTPGSVHVTIEKGAVQMGTNYQGVFTSQDAQSAANQFTQALEKSLSKSQVLQALANGVTG